MSSPLRFCIALVLATVLPLAFPPYTAQANEDPQAEKDTLQEQAAQLGRTGLPLPRFVSLRASQVNLRTGPGTRYPIEWVYRRKGLPVEVVDEFGHWRQIRDWQGTTGWVHQSMLHSRRGALIIGPQQILREKPEDAANAIAVVETGVVGRLETCRSAWCQIRVHGYEGWLPREFIYGIRPNERP